MAPPVVGFSTAYHNDLRTASLVRRTPLADWSSEQSGRWHGTGWRTAAPGRSSWRRRTPVPREHLIDRLVAKADWRMICYTGTAETLTSVRSTVRGGQKAEQRVAAAPADRLAS